MAYSAKVLKDSLSPDGVRLTTLELTLPRIVLAEFNTHRTFSRNSASSRAIPVEKMMQRVNDDPFIPVYWGKNQKGMQAERELDETEIEQARNRWLNAAHEAIFNAEQLLEIGAHKQITNRLLEPWLWQTILVTSTEWDNWDGLRINKDAQPEIKRIAEMAKAARDESWPVRLEHGQWHLPLLDNEEAHKILEEEDVNGWTTASSHVIQRVSAGRCARVSYLTHDGRRDWKEDVALADRLLKAGHMSPFEHVARPMTQMEADRLHARSAVGGLIVPFSADPARTFNGNFLGWTQFRKMIPHEDNFKAALGTMRDLELPVDEE